MANQLWLLTLQSIKKKKKTSILMFVILFISFSFAIAALSVTESIDRSNTEYRLDTYGEWELAVYGGTKQDRAVFQKLEEVGRTGTAVFYGSVLPDAAYGTVDQELKEMGHLSLQEGRFPEQADEIAVEADILSALGYGYALGEKISLTIDVPTAYQYRDAFGKIVSAIPVVREYTLCGVIKEYTDLWARGKTLLPGAIVTEDEAQTVYEIAADENEAFHLQKPLYQYFFLSYGSAEQMINAFRSHPFFTEGEDPEAYERIARELVVNNYAYDVTEQEGNYYFYLIMIFLVTILAVVCVYMVQMQNDVRRLALFRSIGITKKQLRFRMFYETLCFVLPAMLLGSLAGYLGVRLILKAVLNIGARRIYVVVPVFRLLCIGVIWMGGIFLVRFLIFQAALRQPLTGRIQADKGKQRLYRRLKRLLVFFLSVAVSATLIFSCMQASVTLFTKKSAEAMPSYWFLQQDSLNEKLSEEFLMQVDQIPGISHVSAWALFRADLVFDELSECALAEALKADPGRPAAYEGIGVNIYGIREANWMEYIDFEKEGIDREAFRRGEAMLLLFPINASGEVVVGDKAYQAFGIKAGETVTLNFYGNAVKSDQNGIVITSGQEERIMTYTAEVAAIIKVNNNSYTKPFELIGKKAYTLICSAEALERIFQEMPEGYETSYRLTGEAFGYSQGEIFTSEEADYLSTDYVIADLCSAAGLHMTNNREENMVTIQQSVQTLVQLGASSAVILCVSLLILWNTLVLAEEEERRKTGILRAIGLSKRQLQRKLLRETIGSGILSVLCGWFLFGIYLLYRAAQRRAYLSEYYDQTDPIAKLLRSTLESYQTAGIGLKSMLLISVAGVGLVSVSFYAAKRRLFRADVLYERRRRNKKR